MVFSPIWMVRITIVLELHNLQRIRQSLEEDESIGIADIVVQPVDVLFQAFDFRELIRIGEDISPHFLDSCFEEMGISRHSETVEAKISFGGFQIDGRAQSTEAEGPSRSPIVDDHGTKESAQAIGDRQEARIKETPGVLPEAQKYGRGYEFLDNEVFADH